jgi:hypothetical protein
MEHRFAFGRPPVVALVGGSDPRKDGYTGGL